jgi:hypothetical protein
MHVAVAGAFFEFLAAFGGEFRGNGLKMGVE